MQKIFSFFRIVTCVMVMYGTSFGQVQKTESGSIEFFPDFPSAYVVARHLEIWLPEHYGSGQKFAVLYMHDGQMLYDPDNSWNRQSWNADSTASTLMASGKIKDCIIVGIWNETNTRHRDYFPAKPFYQLLPEQKAWATRELLQTGRIMEAFTPFSDEYLKFITEELKPFIDARYHVYTDKENTFIAGSSMGGLISMYAMFEYPEIFGGAACLSTHWPGVFTAENNPIPEKFAEYIQSRLPVLNNHTIYFDYGDQTLDALYPPLQAKVDQVMKTYPSALWTSRFFPGADHSENAWRDRFDEVLLFLLKK